MMSPVVAVLLLVMAINQAGSPEGLERDKANYRIRDIAEVRPDSKPFTGRKEILAPVSGGLFVRIHIVDITFAEINALAKAKAAKTNRNGLDSDDLDDMLTEPDSDEPVVRARRRFGISEGYVTPAVKANFDDDGYDETTWAEIQDYVIDKRDQKSIAQGQPVRRDQ